jgi:hypothetical protein
MIVYGVDGGAEVFSAGTVQWSWGLDDYNAELRPDGTRYRTSRINSSAQMITRNVLTRFLNRNRENE